MSQEQEELTWQKIAILTFTEIPGYLEFFAANFSLPIHKQQYFEIIGSVIARNELMNKEIELSDTKIEVAEAQEAGQILDADAVIISSINVRFKRGKWYDVVIVGASLVDVGTGRIIATSIRSVPIGVMGSEEEVVEDERKRVTEATEATEEVADDMLSVLNELAPRKGLTDRREPVSKETTPVVEREGNWTGNINFFAGKKYFDKGDWKPMEDQTELGIKVDFKKKEWPVSIALGFLYANNDAETEEGSVNSSTYELDIGVKKIWDDHSRFRPFIAGGVVTVNCTYDKTVSVLYGDALHKGDDSNAIGFWVEGGIYWTFNKRFNVGLNARFSTAEGQLFDVDKELGGEHLGILIGYHW